MNMSHLGAVEAALTAGLMIGVVVITGAGILKTAAPSERQAMHTCPDGSIQVAERNTCVPQDIAKLANN